MNSQINLALIGASGVVGEKIMTLLENRATKINNFYPYLLLFIQPVFMASNIIVARGGVEYFPPVSLAFWRWLTVFIILMPFFFEEIFKKKKQFIMITL